MNPRRVSTYPCCNHCTHVGPYQHRIACPRHETGPKRPSRKQLQARIDQALAILLDDSPRWGDK